MPHLFDIFLVPRFSLLTFAAATEPLRIANWLTGHELYKWRLISQDGSACPAASGIPIPVDASVADVGSSETLIVCASADAHAYADKRVLAWLRRLHRGGARIGSVGAGAYLLARAGMLAGRPCTLHWQEHETFQEQFPDLEISPAIYENSGRVFTCAGGTAAIDLMLDLIAGHMGRDFAGLIADQFISSGVRGGDVQQRMRTQIRMGISDGRILRAIELMEANIEAPLSIPELCRMSGISIRHLQRVFSNHLQCTPQQYYLRIRLRLARQRLLHNNESVLQVAISSGFSSASHFCRKYNQLFGHSPRAERRHLQHTGRGSFPWGGSRPEPIAREGA